MAGAGGQHLALIGIVGLGVYHGVNPGMGWLFAVARGLQERRLRAVLLALPFIALGHELSVVAILASGLALEPYFAPRAVKLAAAVALLGLAGVLAVRRRFHPRGFGLRIGAGRLVWWSFLMSSAHGAGLMVLPLLLGLPGGAVIPGAPAALPVALVAGTVHALAMLVTMALVASAVYIRVGVGMLRRGWFNLDLAWTGALLLAGAVALFT